MAKKNGKGKTSAKPSEAALRSLQDKIKRLENKTSQQGKSKKVSLKSKKGKSSGPSVETLSSFARGFLDPFGASHVRVPDSFLGRTATSSSRTFMGGVNGVPSFNFTTAQAFGTILAAPIWKTAAYPSHYSFTPSATRSFFNYDNVPTTQTIDYSKNFTDVNWASAMGMINDGAPWRALRVSGGGVRVQFMGIPPQTPVDVYAVPMFNGDTVMSSWDNVANQRVRHWRLTGDDQIVVPWAVRHTGEAFEWVANPKSGESVTDYPTDDNLTGAVIPNSYQAGVAADRTAANTAIRAWSLQSGLGGWQLAFNLPPGAGWKAETIVHVELQMGQTTSSFYAGDADSKQTYCDSQQLEEVCNLAARSCVKEAVMTGGASSPWEDLRAEFGNQTLNSLTRAVKEHQLIEKTLQLGLGAVASRVK